MAQPLSTQFSSKEADIFLAISAIDQGQIKSERQAVQIYSVPRTTVQRRRVRVTLRRDCEPNSKKQAKLEEEVITRYILNLDARGFAPCLGAVRDIANKLLAERGAG